jgi:hypothetical protein
MFTDLAGFTEMVGNTDREGLRRILADHEELVSPIVRRHQGRVVKNLGDSFLCLFDAATEALRAGLDILDLVASTGARGLRLGLATGDVEEIDGDVFGETVNLAHRILSRTPEAECWFSLATRICMNGKEIPWEPVARLELKGIAGEVEVFRAVPAHRCWLPEPVLNAVRRGRLVRVRRGSIPGIIPPPDPVVLLEGFTHNSPELHQVLESLPVLDPASLWLATWLVPPAERHTWLETGRGLVVGTPQGIERAIIESSRTGSKTTGSDTIIIDPGGTADFVLTISGLALPAVPLSEVVESYTYDLGVDGRWVNRADRPMLRVEVVPDGARAHITAAGVSVDGRGRALDDVIELVDGTRIDTGHGVHVFRALDGEYAGVVLADSNMRLAVSGGQVAEVGREPAHPGLMFIDRRGNANIRWCSGARAAKAKAGGFTMDRALAGRRQASVALENGDLVVTPLHERCTTWRMARDQGPLQRVADRTIVEPGDHLVVGTWVVGIRTSETQ